MERKAFRRILDIKSIYSLSKIMREGQPMLHSFVNRCFIECYFVIHCSIDPFSPSTIFLSLCLKIEYKGIPLSYYLSSLWTFWNRVSFVQTTLCIILKSFEKDSGYEGNTVSVWIEHSEISFYNNFWNPLLLPIIIKELLLGYQSMLIIDTSLVRRDLTTLSKTWHELLPTITILVKPYLTSANCSFVDFWQFYCKRCLFYKFQLSKWYSVTQHIILP